MSPLQTVKFWLVNHAHLAKDALHVYVGLGLMFAAALLFGWRIGGWKPWGVAVAAALIGEIWDLRDSAVFHTRVDLWGNGKDIWNTAFWPSAITLLARWSPVFRSGNRLEQTLEQPPTV